MIGFKAFLREAQTRAQLTPLYRGIAGDYVTGRNDIQHFAADIETAVTYAKTLAEKPENKAKGLKPIVLVISVPSQIMVDYIALSDWPHEFYDIPSSIADRLPKHILDITQAERIAAQHQVNIDANNSSSSSTVMFKNQGPGPNGQWSITVAPMGKPRETTVAVLKSIRDAMPGTVKHPALLQRIQKLGDE